MGFSNFKRPTGKNLTRANEVLSRGSRLEEGEHTVKIVSSEVNEEYASVKLTFVDEEQSKSHTEYIKILQKIWDNEAKAFSDETEMADDFVYLSVGLGLTGAETNELFEKVLDKPSILNGLVGLELQIVIALDDYGVTIAQKDNGKFEIADAGKGKFLDNIEKYAKDYEFDSLQEAGDFLKQEDNKKLLRRAWNKVKLYKEIDQDVSDKNRTAIQSVVDTVSKTAKSSVRNLLDN